MFIDSYIWFQTAALAIFLGLVEVVYLIFGKKERESKKFIEEIRKREGVHTITRMELLKRKILNTNSYQNYYTWLEKQMDLAFEEKDTPQGIIHLQETALLSGLVICLLMLFIVPPFLTIITFLIFICIVFYPPLYYKNIVSNKNKKFDRALPMFINQTILAIRCGVSLQNAFSFSLNSMEPSLHQREYAKMVSELKMSSDDINRVFLNLNKRIQTEECERFCNLVISGLKNGNKMSDILKSEYERILENQIADMRKSADTKQQIGQVINILLIFVPAIMLLVIPMLRIGEMV